MGQATTEFNQNQNGQGKKLDTIGTEKKPANYRNAYLRGVDFTAADLRHAIFAGTDCTDAHFSQANLSNADFNGANLTGAYFTGANLGSANFTDAQVRNAHLNAANLSNTILRNADLNAADLTNSDISGADFSGADVKAVMYEPAKGPVAQKFAHVQNLEALVRSDNPTPLVELRKNFLEAGFESQQRKVHLAIRRNSQGRFERILFDWTCQWGTNPLRPLKLMGGISLLCTLIYWIGLQLNRRSGLYLIATGAPVATANNTERSLRVFAVSPIPIPPKVRLLRWRLRLVVYHILYIRPIIIALRFSLMSVFNLGFQDLSLGRWIRLLETREFDIRAYGWLRVVSGIQALLGAALVALAILSYFGHPFE